jgi:hypothetical protein
LFFFWHERLGHQEKRHVRKLKEGMEINMSMAETGDFFDGCVLGKAIWKISLHGRFEHKSSVS